jgi:[amino group carrier protein]-L-2-aminoadipate 6-kinase
VSNRPAIVVKCGGARGVAEGHVCADVAALIRDGHPVVLAHGGSADIERLAGRLGVPQRQLVAPDGVVARYTDDATLEVLMLALAGAVKPRLVELLAREGVAAVGLTGLDGGLLLARRKGAQRALVDGRVVVVRDSHAGSLVGVNAQLLHALLDAGFLPVVSPPALADDGGAVNVDADRAAAAVAGALGASTLVLLTRAPGVLRDPADDSSALETCTLASSGSPPAWAEGGMALKLVAAREALLQGVREVVVADGAGERPVLAALAGGGTRIELEREGAAA